MITQILKEDYTDEYNGHNLCNQFLNQCNHSNAVRLRMITQILKDDYTDS